MVQYLLTKENGKETLKPMHIVGYKQLAPALNSEAMKILKRLSEKPSFPMELAKDVGMHEQKVYYYIKRLRKAGLIEEVGAEAKRGTVCHYFAPVSKTFGVEIAQTKGVESISKPLELFFHGFIKDGAFDGQIIVGSPWPHGPFKTAARDGHYAIQLAGVLGGLCKFENFAPKLDAEVTDADLKQNLILIGGPVTNMITDKVNKHLPARFEWNGGWKFSGDKKYEDGIGMIAKIQNPWNVTKKIIVLAGIHFENTKDCIEFLAAQKEIPIDREGKGFCIIIGKNENGTLKII